MSWRRIQKQSGFIASYILYGLGLLAIAGVAYGRLNAATQQEKAIQNDVDEIATQIEVIKGKVLLCAAVYPDGDHLQFDARHAYPSPANGTHSAAISAVQCPGAPVGGQFLSAMADGVPVPVTPPNFDEWVYVHTELNGIQLRLEPRVSNGAESTRLRLLRQHSGIATADGDAVVFTLLN